MIVHAHTSARFVPSCYAGIVALSLATLISSEAAVAQRTGQALDTVNKSQDTVRVFAIIRFAGTDNPRQQLDLGVPTKPTIQGPLPVVVLIHGGAFRHGHRSGYLKRAKEFASTGRYAAATVGYRLSGEAIWPAQIHDCKAAVRWLKANATNFNRCGWWCCRWPLGRDAGSLRRRRGTRRATWKPSGPIQSCGMRNRPIWTDRPAFDE